jgi:hypothetical protein
MKKINISFSDTTIEAQLNNTDTAEKIFGILPIEASINRWGDEIYFSTQADGTLEDETETVEEGAIAFWPPGNAFCIFFGPTPASTDERPRAAGPVTVIGRVLNKPDFELLRNTTDGQKIKISRQ